MSCTSSASTSERMVITSFIASNFLPKGSSTREEQMLSIWGSVNEVREALLSPFSNENQLDSTLPVGKPIPFDNNNYGIRAGMEGITFAEKDGKARLIVDTHDALGNQVAFSADLDPNQHAILRMPSGQIHEVYSVIPTRINHDQVRVSKSLNGIRFIGLADGCNWGEGVRACAEAAVKQAIRTLRKSYSQSKKLTDHRVIEFHDEAIFRAQKQVVNMQRKEGTTDTTTLLLVTIVANRLFFSAVGDSKCFVIRRNKREVIDLTGNSRSGGDARDCGGRLGDCSEGRAPDLRNYRHAAMDLEPNDLVITATDGFYDSLLGDPGKTILQLLENEDHLTEERVNEIFFRYIQKVTINSKAFLFTQKGKIPDDRERYPGKLDNSSWAIYIPPGGKCSPPLSN